MTLLTIFLTSFLLALSGAMMPGPLLTVTVSESPRRGAMTGPLLIAGHGILELGLVLCLLMGLAPFFQQEAVFIVCATFGSAVLIWMAWGMLRALPSLSLKGHGAEGKKGNLLITGALLSIANPYWTIWWVSIGMGYILHSRELGKWGVVSFFSGHILADLLWYAAISCAVWKGKSFLSDRTYRIFIGACALFLIGFAVLFAGSGLQKLIS